MKLYKVFCSRCGWKAPLPVDETAAINFRATFCRNCQAQGVHQSFTVKEHIAVGAYTKYLPGRKPSDA